MLTQVEAVMSRPATKQNFDYPDQTKGSRLAARVRKTASQLSETERAALFNQGMQIIYGGAAPKKAVRTGR